MAGALVGALVAPPLVAHGPPSSAVPVQALVLTRVGGKRLATLAPRTARHL